MRRPRLWFALGLLIPVATIAPAAEGDREVMTIKGWGTAVDPDGDCRFSVDRDRVAIAIPGSVHDLSAERGRMNAPRVLRDVEGDFVAEVRVLGDFPTGATSLVPERRPFHGAGLILWADPTTYVRLERAEMVVDGRDHSYLNFELRDDRRFLRAGNSGEHPLTVGPTYLRLERRGTKILGSVSTDGERWSTLAPIEVNLPRRLKIGVSATHNTTTPFEPKFEGFRVLREGPSLE